MKNASLPLLVILFLSGLLSEAAVFSGSLKTKHGAAIASCKLIAQPVTTGSPVEFVSDRSGNFSVNLGEGEWTLTADVEQILAWGFAQMNGVTVSIVGESPSAKNLVLLASEPLRTPSLTFSRSSTGALSFLAKGQGGTRVTIYSSTDLVNWSSYYSRAISTTGFNYTVNNPPGSFPRRYFRAGASTD